MSISNKEIKEWASRYVPVEDCDFPADKELFFFLSRDLPDQKILKENEGWQFSGYGYCLGYSLDETAKPMGKWVFMHYLDLAQYPLEENSLKLQPPHITNGRFYSQDRTMEIRIVKCHLSAGSDPILNTENLIQEKTESNVIQFPGNK